ncbi:hypothetical protein COCSADRAFT_40657 [Bipolaris sorokiniana ND90Pr]|uniref:Uncharacterized protein n=1 Tax=Cochliobolus sativus (strain ND90Pr / ATCC 201652) TaxID=665912 RepID=M2ST08_COCSN|nr:uncharacterized protein COCSADRAFT_40657 [Bipolaris sorokiniana ND90Pr]EMD60216.1 hypothetical protein COCSADRAFT_40657 [Bipolaris sorokiniana ND90Pr]
MRTWPTGHCEHESKALVDPSHGPFTLDIHFQTHYSNSCPCRQKNIPHAFQLSDSELRSQWRTAFRTSDLYMTGTNRIPDTLFELFPLFARFAGRNINTLMIWQVCVIYIDSAWHREGIFDHLCYLLRDLALGSEHEMQITAPADDSVGDDNIVDDEEDYVMSGDEDSVLGGKGGKAWEEMMTRIGCCGYIASSIWT